jgi:hypothetical protein
MRTAVGCCHAGWVQCHASTCFQLDEADLVGSPSCFHRQQKSAAQLPDRKAEYGRWGNEVLELEDPPGRRRLADFRPGCAQCLSAASIHEGLQSWRGMHRTRQSWDPGPPHPESQRSHHPQTGNCQGSYRQPRHRPPSQHLPGVS